jgi:ABC-type glutathione transport system ATPase component
MTRALLEVRDLDKVFQVGRATVHALRRVSLRLERGECHAVVGESGSGKSTLANLVLGLMEPSAGDLLFNGQVLPARRPLALRRAIQLVQQNPLSALNRARTIGASLRLPLDVHDIGSKRERGARVARLLREVGLDASLAGRLPASLSGGQRQRVAIARALACEPALLVLDEPTSALDVLVQARMLRLLDMVKQQHGLTYLFITHDLAVVRSIADRVTVLEHGQVVETGTVAEVFAAPREAYTRRLLAAVPVVSAADAVLRDRLRADNAALIGD